MDDYSLNICLDEKTKNRNHYHHHQKFVSYFKLCFKKHKYKSYTVIGCSLLFLVNSYEGSNQKKEDLLSLRTICKTLHVI